MVIRLRKQNSTSWFSSWFSKGLRKSRQRRRWDRSVLGFANSWNPSILPKPTARDSLNPHRKVDLGLLGFFLLMIFFVALTAVYVSPEDFSRNKPQLWGTMDAIDTSCHTCHSNCNCNALALNTEQTWNSFLLLLFNGESTASSTCGLSWTSTSSLQANRFFRDKGTALDTNTYHRWLHPINLTHTRFHNHYHHHNNLSTRRPVLWHHHQCHHRTVALRGMLHPLFHFKIQCNCLSRSLQQCIQLRIAWTS